MALLTAIRSGDAFMLAFGPLTRSPGATTGLHWALLHTCVQAVMSYALAAVRLFDGPDREECC